MEKMKRILDKKGLWLALCLVFRAVNTVLILIGALMMSHSISVGDYSGFPTFVVVFGNITVAVSYLYYAYRLLYLYRGTEKRALWTGLTIASLVISLLPSNAGLSVLNLVISLCCWIHDINVVIDSSNKKKKAVA